MLNKGVIALAICAVASIATAIAHLSCIFIGPSCFEAQMAPEELVLSSRNGTLLAPIATVIVSCLFILCGLFALSGAGIIKKLPFLNIALVVISLLCIIRGLSTVPLSFAFPQTVSVFSISAGIVWFICGLLFAYGYIYARRKFS